MFTKSSVSMKSLFGAVFLSLVIFGNLLSPISTSAQDAPLGAADTGTVGQGGLGADIDIDQRGDINPVANGDLQFQFIDRNNILITTTNPSKPFGTGTLAGLPTYGELFGEGVIVTDSDTDGNLNYQNAEFGMMIDFFNNNDRIVRDMSSDQRHFGSVDQRLITGFEFTWVIRTDRVQGDEDRFIALRSDGTFDRYATSTVGDDPGLSVTGVTDRENFNISLVPSGSGNSLSLVSTDGIDTFVQVNNRGETVFAFNRGNLNEGYLSFRGNNTVEDLSTGTGFLTMNYFRDGTNIGEISILRGGDPRLEASLAAAGENGTADGSAAAPSCESEGGAFSWLLCPLLDAANDSVSWIDERITNFLDINSSYFTDTSTRAAWARMRNLAFILLIPILLVMVIGTALGFSFVDAYTVKRSLPRLFIAIFFIALSYDICRILIDVSNTVGRGTAGLIAQPFGGLETLTLDRIFTAPSGVGGNLLWGGILSAVALSALSAVSLGILGSLLLVATLGLLAVLLLLVTREFLIVFLLIVSPLAILSWIFPGNDKLWKLWWNSFEKLLLLFPVIMAILVSGRAFASIVQEIPSEENAVLLTVVKTVAYIGPYFFIPAAFKFAGGAFANLAGMVNNREKGLFDRARKYRGDKRASIKEKARAGDRFGNTPGLRRLNDVVGKGFAAKDAGLSAVRRGGIASQYSKNTQAAADEFGEKNRNFNAFSGDDVVTSASLEDTEAKMREKLIEGDADRFGGAENEKVLRQTIQMIKQAKSDTGEIAYKKAAVIALAKAGTYFQDAGHMAEFINGVYGDDRQGAGAAMMAAKSASMSSGRVDIGGSGAGAALGALQDHYLATRDIKDNTSPQADQARETAKRKATQKVISDVVESQGANVLTHPSMKKKYIEQNVIPEIQRRLDTALSSGNQELIQRELASAANMYDTLSQTSPAMGELFANQVMRYSPGSGGTHQLQSPGTPGPQTPGHLRGRTTRELIEDNRQAPAFLERRRELNSTDEQRRRLGGNGQTNPPGGPPNNPPGQLPPPSF